MRTSSWFCLPLVVAAIIGVALAQADPSIQAPAATIPIDTAVTIHLFGTLPPFTVQLVQPGTSNVPQVIAPEYGFFQLSWTTPSPPTISCSTIYALEIIDVVGRSALSSSFIFTGCPDLESTVTSTFTETVTESASTVLSCPVSVSASVITSTVTESSCPASVSSFTKITKVIVSSTVTVTRVETDRDVTTVTASGTRTVTEYAHTTTTTIDNTRTKTKTVCPTVTTTRKHPCHMPV